MSNQESTHALYCSCVSSTSVAARKRPKASAAGDAGGGVVSEAVLRPTWFDLLMWAVCAGERRIARSLWRECEQPLRAAILAARVARRLSHDGHGRSARRFAEDADAYEELATGLLGTAVRARGRSPSFSCKALARVDCYATTGPL